MMAQYLKIHFMRYTNYVQSFMLLSRSAQLFCYAVPLLWQSFKVFVRFLKGGMGGGAEGAEASPYIHHRYIQGR